MLAVTMRGVLNSDLIGPLIGAAAAGGLVLMWSATVWDAAPVESSDGFKRSRFSLFEPWQYAAAVLAGGLVWVVTGWPSLAVAAAVTAMAAPTLVVSTRSEADFAERTEAVAGWVDSLRDAMRGRSSIEGALRVTAATAPLAIRPALNQMNRRVSLGVSLPDAMAQMADEVNNPVCDLVVSVLIHALDLSSAQLPVMLDTIAQQAREQAHAHLQVHTSRARSRTQLRLVTLVVFLSLAMFFVAFADYLEPLSGPSGQLIVAGSLAVLGVCVLWIARLSAFPEHSRVLDPTRGLTTRTGT